MFIKPHTSSNSWSLNITILIPYSYGAHIPYDPYLRAFELSISEEEGGVLNVFDKPIRSWAINALLSVKAVVALSDSMVTFCCC